MGQLNPRALGTAMGAIFGVSMFLIVLINHFFNPQYALSFIVMMSSVYPGFTTGGGGAIFGLVYGFIDGFVFGYVLAWLYNKLA